LRIFYENVISYDDKVPITDLIKSVLPTLMNSTIVSLLNDFKDGIISKNVSEKSLLGYCSFHHMLLYYCQKYPEIKEDANNLVKNFIDKEEKKKEIMHT